jgi:glucan phosphorylase
LYQLQRSYWRLNQPNSNDDSKKDADDLYHLLENEIVPLYYQRDSRGIPHGWLRIVKESIRSILPEFSTRRMVKEYTEKMYLPAAGAKLPSSSRFTVQTANLAPGLS